MKSHVVRPQPYILAAVLVSFLSLAGYYAVNLGSSVVDEPRVPAVAEALDVVPKATVSTGFSGFFSFENPLAWFMFGAWFALLLFFVLSLMVGHTKK